MRSLQAAESQVKKYESRLSEEDIVPADITAIQALRDQLKVRPININRHSSINSLCIFCQHLPPFLFLCQKWHSELQEQDQIFQSLTSEVQRAQEAGTQLSQLHSDRSPELDRYQEKAHQLTERWNGVRRQMETR